MVVARTDSSKTFTVIDRWSNFGLGYTIPQPFRWSQDEHYFYFKNLPVPDGCSVLLNASDLQRVDLRTGQIKEVMQPVHTWILLAPNDKTVAAVNHGVLLLGDIAEPDTRRTDFALTSNTESIGAIQWSTDSKQFVLAQLFDVCTQTPFGSKSSIVWVDATSGQARVLIKEDARRFVAERWRSLHEVLLRDKDFQRWILNTKTGALRQDSISEDYPLSVGTKWVYQDTRYDGFNPNLIMTATRMTTHTVVAVIGQEPYRYLKVRLEENPETLSAMKGNYPMTDTLRPARISEYVLPVETIHMQQRIYFRQGQLDQTKPPSQATWAELVLPLVDHAEWCGMEVDSKDSSHRICWPLTQARAQRKVVMSAGRFSNCYWIRYAIGGSGIQNLFCPGVGWVIRQDDHAGTPFGSRSVLKRFVPAPLQKTSLANTVSTSNSALDAMAQLPLRKFIITRDYRRSYTTACELPTIAEVSDKFLAALQRQDIHALRPLLANNFAALSYVTSAYQQAARDAPSENDIYPHTPIRRMSDILREIKNQFQASPPAATPLRYLAMSVYERSSKAKLYFLLTDVDESMAENGNMSGHYSWGVAIFNCTSRKFESWQGNLSMLSSDSSLLKPNSICPAPFTASGQDWVICVDPAHA